MDKLLRKVMCVLLSITMVSAFSIETWAKGFTDVPAGEWYAQAVEYVEDAGLFSGKGNEKFDPDGVMNRAMMVQVLANATENYQKENFTTGGFLGTGINCFEPLPYTDVDESQTWYGPPIRWATMYQIVSGKGNGKFAPFDAVTREETAVMLYRYAQKTENDVNHRGTSLKKFPDANAVSSWAKDAMDWAVEKGILKGYPNGSLQPKKRITRAEAAMVFLNAKDAVKKRTAIYPMTQTAQKLGITADTYPKVDGSGLTQSLAGSLYRTMYGTYDPHGVHHSKTRSAYEKLIAGDTDLILVPAAEDLLKKAKSQGAPLESYEIAKEGLAFLTPKQNTAKNVSIEQLQQIYGDYSIQNWSKLGGENQALFPLCGTSGLDDDRQAQLEDQILQGLPLSERIQEQYAFDSWNEMIYRLQETAQAEIDGFGIAPCGYTMHRDFSNYQHRGLKLLSVNGVMPTEKNIADGSYPLTYSYYAVIRADEPANSPARTLAQWLRTEEAGELVEQSGLIKPF